MKKERTLEVYLVRMDPLTKPMQVSNDSFLCICYFYEKLVLSPYALSTILSDKLFCVRDFYTLNTLKISTTHHVKSKILKGIFLSKKK